MEFERLNLNQQLALLIKLKDESEYSLLYNNSKFGGAKYDLDRCRAIYCGENEDEGILQLPSFLAPPRINPNNPYSNCLQFPIGEEPPCPPQECSPKIRKPKPVYYNPPCTPNVVLPPDRQITYANMM